MMRIRRWAKALSSDLSGFGRLQRQFKREGGTESWSWVFDIEGSAHFFGGERTTVQAKSMAVFAGREPMIENPEKVFARDNLSVLGEGSRSWGRSSPVHDLRSRDRGPEFCVRNLGARPL
jgi:hypothetical protein